MGQTSWSIGHPSHGVQARPLIDICTRNHACRCTSTVRDSEHVKLDPSRRAMHDAP
jgi:hypothetical protein